MKDAIMFWLAREIAEVISGATIAVVVVGVAVVGFAFVAWIEGRSR